MNTFVRFILALGAMLPLAAFAQTCPALLGLQIDGRYYADDELDVYVLENALTQARIVGMPGPYTVALGSADGTPAAQVLDFTQTDDMLQLEGLDPGVVNLEVTTLDMDRRRLRIHVVDTLPQQDPPPPHFFRGGVRTGIGNMLRDRARLHDQARLDGVLCPFAEQAGEEVDVLVVAQVRNRDGSANWYNVTGENRFVRWDGRVASLQPFLRNFALERGHAIRLFNGPVNRAGEVRIFTGYVGENGLVYDTEPQVVTLEE